MSFGATLRDKAIELIIGGLIFVGAGYMATTFVSKTVYAEDQAGFVKAIEGIVPALKFELTARKYSDQITENNTLIQRLQRYIDADPDSRINTARLQEIAALQADNEDLDRKLKLHLEMPTTSR